MKEFQCLDLQGACGRMFAELGHNWSMYYAAA